MGASSSSPKFSHRFNGDMRYLTYRPNEDDHTMIGLTTQNGIPYYNFEYFAGFLASGADNRGIKTYKLRTMVIGSGPPFPGRATVDADGNLAYKGSGYTYILYGPGLGTYLVDEARGDDGSRKMSGTGRVAVYKNDDFNQPLGVQMIKDKNSTYAWYVHSGYLLKPSDSLAILTVYLLPGDTPRNGVINFQPWHPLA